MSSLYFAYNGPMMTTGPFTAVTTGTATKTMLQVATASTGPIRVVKWGISFDSAGGGTTPIKCELLETDVAATVTAHVAAGVQPYGADQSASGVIINSTTATGYTATAEGTIAATRYGDTQWVAPGNYFQNEWSLGREFFVRPSKFLRIRVNTSVAQNCICWILWDE